MDQRRGSASGFTAAVVALALFASGAVLAAESLAQKQVPISHRAKAVINVDGLSFKDLNGDLKLNAYEDWRLPVEIRARDLVARMSIDEKLGLMVIGSQKMGAPPATHSRSPFGDAIICKGPTSADGILCEEKVVSTMNIWALPGSPMYQYPRPIVWIHATTEGIQKWGVRRMIVRENPRPDALTTWTNRIQEVAEASRLGIPVVMTSNPRNHASADLAFGFQESSGQFSLWPGTLGLAATQDVTLVKEFASIAAREWNATGIRAGYMYMADLATDPRWFRIDGTFGDDPVLVSNMMEAVVHGFQGLQLGPDGVLLTTKHFPGGGPRHKGSDPHYIYGKVSPYPTKGSLYQYHLPPFTAAIAAGSAAIMPYYSVPMNDRSVPQLNGGAQFEEVGFGFNRAILQDLLRTQLGFKGYVNSDSGILVSMPWGEKIESMDVVGRAGYAINAGVDVISDMSDVGVIGEAYERGLISDARVDVAAQRLLEPMFKLGLFENPYRDVKKAVEVVATPEHWARAYEAHRKSVVLLKNSAGLLPLTDEKLSGKKVYVEVFAGDERTDSVIATLTKVDPSLQFTKSLEEASFAVLFVSPADKTERKTESYFDLQLHKATMVDTDRIKAIQAKIPSIINVNLEMPWLLGGIEPGARALLAGFGTRVDAVLDVIRGRVNPQARLPITMPRNMEVIVAAETNGPQQANGVTSSDVPGYLRPQQDNYVYVDEAGARYRTGFGLSYQHDRNISRQEREARKGRSQ